MENLWQDIEKAKNVAIILFDKFNSDEGIFGKNIMPEDLLWGSGLSGSGVVKGSHEHLMFITMVASIDYMRNADKLWEAGRKTMEDETAKWLFFPDQVINKPVEEIILAMRKHKLSQKHIRDSKIWKTVSVSLARIYDSDPIMIIDECGYDALKLYEKKFDFRFKKSFPSLSGNKIFPLWIRMLHDNAGVELKNLDKVPIPVDVHIARSTFTTGCLRGEYSGTIEGISPKISEAWEKILAQIDHPNLRYALQMDEPLWNLSKYGCRFRKDDFCPQKRSCAVSGFCTKGTIHVSAKEVTIKT